MYHNLEISTCYPLKYKMDISILCGSIIRMKRDNPLFSKTDGYNKDRVIHYIVEGDKGFLYSFYKV